MASIRALEKKYFLRLPSFDYEALLSLAIKKPKEFIFAHPEYCLSIYETLRFFYFRKQYERGYSIASLRGHKEFFGLDFLVTKDTLVPRPDTELMVEAVVERLKEQTTLLRQGSGGQAKNREQIVLIDIGTGTGCIPISIIKALKHQNIKTIAIDLSKKALRVAQKNAKYHQVCIEFLVGNLLEPVFNNETMKQYNNETIILTANLPYLTIDQYHREKSIQREPYSALVAGENGLALYRELLEQITTKLLPDYKNHLTLYFEIDPSQNLAVTQLIKKYLPQASISIHKDLVGHDRLVAINLPSQW